MRDVAEKESQEVALLRPPSESALRDELERLVLLDLLGPAGGPDEEVEGNVRDRYLVGMLAPSQQQIQPEELDQLALEDGSGAEDGANDPGNGNVLTLNPSSMGMSFSVAHHATELLVTASWGRYVRVQSETLTKATGAPALVWKRQPMGGKPLHIPLKAGPLADSYRPEPEEQPEVRIKGIVRSSEHSWTITLFLVNEQREPERNRDAAWLFQPQLSVEAPDQSAIFQ